MCLLLLSGISICFQMLSHSLGQVTYVLLTRPPLAGDLSSFGASTINQLGKLARLACIRHAASVHPEPGSNSHLNYIRTCISSKLSLLLSELTSQMFCFKSHRDFRPYTLDSSKLCSVFKGTTCWPIKQPINIVIITYIRLACQEEILINFEFLLIDNSISNFINISCHQVDVNNYF